MSEITKEQRLCEHEWPQYDLNSNFGTSRFCKKCGVHKNHLPIPGSLEDIKLRQKDELKVWKGPKGSLHIRDHNGDFICSIEPYNLITGAHKEHLERIAACVNALNGARVPTEALKDGVIDDMIATLKGIHNYYLGGEPFFEAVSQILAKLEGK